MRPIMAAVMLIWAAGCSWAQASDSMAPSGSAAGQANHSATDAQSNASSPTVEQRFESADLNGKLAIIAALAVPPPKKIAPLLQKSIDYLVANLDVLRSQPEAESLAIDTVKLIGSLSYRPAAESMWQLFQFTDSTAVRLATADALATVAKGNDDVINKMNHWLAGQNLLQKSGAQVDPPSVEACVKALGTLGDASSFSVLFATMKAGYGKKVSDDARKALNLLGGDRGAQYLRIVENGRYADREVAFQMALADKGLTAAQRASVATAALGAALSAPAGTNADVLATLRFPAVRELGRLEWTPADRLLLENFNRVASEYQKGAISRQQLVESASALSAMGTHEAAVRLSLYLDYVNSMMNKGRPFYQSVTLSIIRDLGNLGDPVAYQPLTNVQYLPYNDSVKAAAQQAVRNLED